MAPKSLKGAGSVSSTDADGCQLEDDPRGWLKALLLRSTGLSNLLQASFK